MSSLSQLTLLWQFAVHVITGLCQQNPGEGGSYQRQHSKRRQENQEAPRGCADPAPPPTLRLHHGDHHAERVLLRHGSPLGAYDEDLRRVVARADQSLSAEPLGDPSEAAGHPGVPKCAPCVLVLRPRHLQWNLQSLRLFQRFLLLPDEGEMSADGAHDAVSNVSVAGDTDQRFDQTVVAEDMSAAERPLCARQTLVADRTLLLSVLLGESHEEWALKCTPCQKKCVCLARIFLLCCFTKALWVEAKAAPCKTGPATWD